MSGTHRGHAASLVVVSGPIGAGKSTVAHGLSAYLAAHEVSAASIELDVVARMVARVGEFPTLPEWWSMGRHGVAALSDGLVAAGVSVVVVEGDFWNRWARAEFEPLLRSSVTPRYVTLVVSYEVALERVKGDVARGVSRDPAFLRRNHDAFQARLDEQPASDLVLDGDAWTPDELVEELVAQFELLKTSRVT